MIYLNLYIADANSTDAASATDAEFGAWIRLLLHCAEQENGGMIEGAKKFDARKWLSIVKVDEKIIKKGSPLWEWDGQNLVVKNYPLDQEEKYKAKRDQTQIAGRISAEKRKAELEAMERALNERSTNAEPTMNRKETKQKETKKNETTLTVRGESCSFDEALDELKSMGLPNPEKCAREFIDANEASGWTIDGQPVRSWRALLRKWKFQTDQPSQPKAPNTVEWGSPPPKKAIPIEEVIRDDEAIQAWKDARGKYWVRTLGYLEGPYDSEQDVTR